MRRHTCPRQTHRAQGCEACEGTTLMPRLSSYYPDDVFVLAPCSAKRPSMKVCAGIRVAHSLQASCHIAWPWAWHAAHAAGAGGRRLVAGGSQQVAGGRRQAAASTQQAAGGRRQAAGGRRHAAGTRQPAGRGTRHAAGGRQQAADRQAVGTQAEGGKRQATAASGRQTGGRRQAVGGRRRGARGRRQAASKR